MDIQELVRAQRAYFLSGATRSYAFRMEQMKKLQQALRLAGAVWRCADHLAVELSRSTLPVAAGRRDLRRQLRHRKAVGLCPRGQRGHREAHRRDV